MKNECEDITEYFDEITNQYQRLQWISKQKITEKLLRNCTWNARIILLHNNSYSSTPIKSDQT